MEHTINITYDNDHQQPVVSSLQVAEDFNKNHRDVLKAIENLKEGVAQNFADLFYKAEYVHPQNKQHYPMYLMNRDGFSLLVMGFTGKEALDWKLKYIQAFNAMEKQVRNEMSTEEKVLLNLQYSKEISDHVKEVDAKASNNAKEIQKVAQDVEERFDNLPLLGIDCDTLQDKVRKVAVKALGGYGSNAYNNKSLHGKVFADVQRQLKREFDVKKYKAITRKQLDTATQILDDYKLPMELGNQIKKLNTEARDEKD